MRKIFTFLLALVASVGMMNAKVTWNSSNISDLSVFGTYESYSKEGVTLSANADEIYAMWYSSGDESMDGIGFDANKTGGFTFSNTLGKNFTKIEMTLNDLGGWNYANLGSGWSFSGGDGNPATVTWTGNASTVDLAKDESSFHAGDYVKSIVFYFVGDSEAPDPTYTIALQDGTVNADKVKLSATSAVEGATITVTPNEEYEITAFSAYYVVVNGQLGSINEIDATLDPGTGAYSFTMPAYDVTIEATIALKPVYTVALKAGTVNADKVTLSATSVLAGKTVTVTPNEECEITAFKATYNTTEELSTSFNAETGAYSFTMPAYDVTIEATIALKPVPEGDVFAGFTATAGSGGFNNEGSANLVDNKFTSGNEQTDWTKWCANDGHKSVPTGESESCWWIDFEASAALSLTGYILTTGNDTGSEHGRNPKNWLLKAKLNADDAWTTIATVTDDVTMKNKSFKDYKFFVDQSGSYQYFRFEVFANQGANVMQLCELRLIGTEPALVTTHTLQLHVNDAAMGSVAVTNLLGSDIIDNGDGTYDVPEGAEVTLLATPNEGYEFSGWKASRTICDFAECEFVDLNTVDNPLTFDMYAEAAFMAEFAAVAPADNSVKLYHNFYGDWAETEAFGIFDDYTSEYAKISMILEPGDYQFALKVGGELRGDGTAFSRDKQACILAEGLTANLTLNVDVKGTYRFYWFYEENRFAMDVPNVCGMYWQDVTDDKFEVTLGKESEVTLPTVYTTNMGFASNIFRGVDQVRLVSTDETVATIEYTLSMDGLGTITIHKAGECDIYAVHDITDYYCYDSVAFHLTVLPESTPVADLSKDIAIDLRDGQLGSDNNGSKYLIIDSENNYTYLDAEPASYNVFFEFANFNGAQHGYTNLKAAVPVEAGNYKLTLGACGYGNGSGTVKNEDLSETLASFNQQIEANTKCYHQNTAENIVTATFSVTADQTIHITCGNYTPYFKLEKLEAQEFTVTFAAEGAEGSIPAARNIVEGESLTIPANQTLYKEGYTLTGWNDGENTYAAGASYSPTANVTLTAVFTANVKALLTAQTETSVKWIFGESNGAPSMHLEGGVGHGFLVAQATVDGESQDIKLAIDATSGKFNNNGRADKWAQVNANTTFSFPSKQDIAVAIEAYSGAAAYSLSEGILTVTTNDYFSYLQVTYPASQATGVDNAKADGKVAKLIRNGQLLIIRDGKTYNVVGTIVR